MIYRNRKAETDYIEKYREGYSKSFHNNEVVG